MEPVIRRRERAKAPQPSEESRDPGKAPELCPGRTATTLLLMERLVGRRHSGVKAGETRSGRKARRSPSGRDADWVRATPG